MTPALLSAIKASLATPAHAWDLLSVYDHGHGAVAAEGGDQVESIVARTFQLISRPLDLMLSITTEGLVDDQLVTVVYDGTTFRTRDPALASSLGRLVAAIVPVIEADFIAHLNREVS